MGMTPRERILAVYSGEEPDKTPVLIPKTLRRANPGWYQRLEDRGAALLGIATVYEPPVGTITGVVATNPTGPGANYAPHPVEHAVKQPSDWRVVNYFYKQTLDSLVPTSKETFERVEKAIGDDGVVTAFLSDYTPWQNAWIWLAGPETAVTHFYEQPAEVQEFIDLSNRLHTRLAEFAAKMFSPKICYPYHTGDTDLSVFTALMKDVEGVEVRIRSMK